MSSKHCAYCLKRIEDSIKYCGRCNRRPYCSKDCQTVDWNNKSKGQRHKLWCGKKYGEEDEDWIVAPVEFGLGVVALQDIPIHFPIIVERGLEDFRDHPGVEDMLPSGGSLEEKWDLNKMGTLIGKSVLALRTARANHNCVPNASHYYDERNGLKILISNRNIRAGEEICISYTNLGDVANDLSVGEHLKALSEKWDIHCPASCLCRTAAFLNASEHAKVLDFAIMDFGRNGETDLAIQAGEDMLEQHRQRNSGHSSIVRTLYDLFQVCITRRSTVETGMQYLQEAYDLCVYSTGQTSEDSCKYAALLASPSSHPAYLLFDLSNK